MALNDLPGYDDEWDRISSASHSPDQGQRLELARASVGRFIGSAAVAAIDIDQLSADEPPEERDEDPTDHEYVVCYLLLPGKMPIDREHLEKAYWIAAKRLRFASEQDGEADSSIEPIDGECAVEGTTLAENEYLTSCLFRRYTRIWTPAIQSNVTYSVDQAAELHTLYLARLTAFLIHGVQVNDEESSIVQLEVKPGIDATSDSHERHEQGKAVRDAVQHRSKITGFAIVHSKATSSNDWHEKETPWYLCAGKWLRGDKCADIDMDIFYLTALNHDTLRPIPIESPTMQKKLAVAVSSASLGNSDDEAIKSLVESLCRATRYKVLRPPPDESKVRIISVLLGTLIMDVTADTTIRDVKEFILAQWRVRDDAQRLFIGKEVYGGDYLEEEKLTDIGLTIQKGIYTIHLSLWPRDYRPPTEMDA